MIAFVQEMHRNNILYKTIDSRNKSTSHIYSHYSQSKVQPWAEKNSFAHKVSEVHNKSHSNVCVKAKAKDENNLNDKKSKNKDEINTSKDTEKQQKNIVRYSLDKRKLKDDRVEDEEILKVATKGKRDDENMLYDAHLQKLYTSRKSHLKIKHKKTHDEREIVKVSAQLRKTENVDGQVKSTEQSEDKNIRMFEKQPRNAFIAVGRENYNSSSVSTQEMHSHITGEFEKSLENTHCNTDSKSMPKIHKESDITAEREEHTSHFSHDDEFMRDEDTQKYSKNQLRLKFNSERHAHTKVSLEMTMHDDGKEKPQLLGTVSHISLNTIHEKKNYLRNMNSPLLEKKGLSYLTQHGNQKIVQDVKLLFRENSTGDIRLQLHPKELGDVKLIVKIDDNNLVHARSIVSSEDAKDLMQKNLGNLAKHFNSEGYEIGSFSVSVNAEHSDTNDGTQQFLSHRSQRDENVYAAEVEQNIRSYVKAWQSIDFVA